MYALPIMIRISSGYPRPEALQPSATNPEGAEPGEWYSEADVSHQYSYEQWSSFYPEHGVVVTAYQEKNGAIDQHLALIRTVQQEYWAPPSVEAWERFRDAVVEGTASTGLPGYELGYDLQTILVPKFRVTLQVVPADVRVILQLPTKNGEILIPRVNRYPHESDYPGLKATIRQFILQHAQRVTYNHPNPVLA
jgi:hypothetical protein